MTKEITLSGETTEVEAKNLCKPEPIQEVLPLITKEKYKAPEKKAKRRRKPKTRYEEFAEQLNTEDSLYSEKLYAFGHAAAFGYSTNIFTSILNAKTEIQIDNALARGRHESL